MSYRIEIERRARQAAEAARDKVLSAELRLLEHELPLFQADRWADEREIADLRSAIRWLRRVLKAPTPPGEKKRRRPHPAVEPEPEPVVEEAPDGNVCWHPSRRCAKNHKGDLFVLYGRCRADEGWFWSAESLDPDQQAAIKRSGFAQSAALALLQARLCVIELAAGRPTVAKLNHDRAAWALREIASHPQARPQARDLLSVLKDEMVRAHPDRGGSDAAFIAARRRFIEARRRTRAP